MIGIFFVITGIGALISVVIALPVIVVSWTVCYWLELEQAREWRLWRQRMMLQRCFDDECGVREE